MKKGEDENEKKEITIYKKQKKQTIYFKLTLKL